MASNKGVRQSLRAAAEKKRKALEGEEQKVAPPLGADRAHLSRYQEDDMLTATQAAEVVSENSNRVIRPGSMANVVMRGRIPGARKFGHAWMYPYAEIRDMVVSRQNAGPKKKDDKQVGASALRVRQLRERRRAAAAAGTLENVGD